MRRRQAHRHDTSTHLRRPRHVMRRRRHTGHGVVVILIAQPRRFHSHGPKHAVDRTDAPQQVADRGLSQLPVAAIIDALIRLDFQQRGLGPDIYRSAIPSQSPHRSSRRQSQRRRVRQVIRTRVSFLLRIEPASDYRRRSRSLMEGGPQNVCRSRLINTARIWGCSRSHPGDYWGSFVAEGDLRRIVSLDRGNRPGRGPDDANRDLQVVSERASSAGGTRHATCVSSMYNASTAAAPNLQ